MSNHLKDWHRAIIKAGFYVKRDNGGHIVYSNGTVTFAMPSPVRKNLESRGSNNHAHIRKMLRGYGVDV